MERIAFEPIEKALKALYEAHASLDLFTPHPMRYFFDVLPEYAQVIQDREGAFTTDSLLTEGVFHHGLDIAVNRHWRYMPPFIHGHTFFETVYVAGGACVNHIGGKRIEMKAGNVCIIAPYTDHALSAFSDDAVVYNLLMRASTFQQAFMSIMPRESILYTFFNNILNARAEGSFVFFRAPEDQQILDTFQAMVNAYDEQRGYYGNMVNLLSGVFFVLILSKYEQELLLSDSLDRHLHHISVMHIFRYITEHLQSVTLPELSAHFGYSERQMSRLLNTYTGKNFVELVRLERLSKAAELLKNPEITVTDAAWMVGYPNYKYFYRLFCDRFHKTPLQYKREYQPVV